MKDTSWEESAFADVFVDGAEKVAEYLESRYWTEVKREMGQLWYQRHGVPGEANGK